MRSLHVFDASVAIMLSIAGLACSGARTVEPARAAAERRSAASERDVVELSLEGWTATRGSTALERFVGWRDATSPCAVRVTHMLPQPAGSPPIDPSPVTVLARRDVIVDGEHRELLTTSEAEPRQSIAVTVGARSATIAFIGCDREHVDRVLSLVHIAGAEHRPPRTVNAPPTSATPTLPSAIPEGTAIVVAPVAGQPVPARAVDPQSLERGELIRETSPVTPLRDGESVRFSETALRRTFESEDWIAVDADRGSFAVAVASLLTEVSATRSPDRRWAVFVQCVLRADVCAHSVTVVGPRLERLDAVGAGGYPPYHVEAVWRADGARVAISTYEVGPRARLRVIEIPSLRVVSAIENVTGPVFTADGSLLARRDEDEAVVAITDGGEIRRVFGLRGTPPPVVDDGGEAAAYDPPSPVVLLEGGATLCANFRRGRRQIGVVATREGHVTRTGPECPSPP